MAQNEGVSVWNGRIWQFGSFALLFGVSGQSGGGSFSIPSDLYGPFGLLVFLLIVFYVGVKMSPPWWVAGWVYQVLQKENERKDSEINRLREQNDKLTERLIAALVAVERQADTTTDAVRKISGPGPRVRPAQRGISSIEAP